MSHPLIESAVTGVMKYTIDATKAQRAVAPGEAATAGVNPGQFTGTLTHFPLASIYGAAPVATSDSLKTATLNFDGTVTGDVDPGGTFDPVTGAYDFTFDDGALSTSATFGAYWGGNWTGITAIAVELTENGEPMQGAVFVQTLFTGTRAGKLLTDGQVTDSETDLEDFAQPANPETDWEGVCIPINTLLVLDSRIPPIKASHFMHFSDDDTDISSDLLVMIFKSALQAGRCRDYSNTKMLVVAL